MKRFFHYIVCFFGLFLSLVASGQISVSKVGEPTSKLIVEISADWKHDSLTKLGLRQKNAARVLRSKLDSVTKFDLLTNWGRPNEIRNTNHGQELVYYYFDYRVMPKGHDAPLACWYIAFLFPAKSNLATELRDGDIDL